MGGVQQKYTQDYLVFRSNYKNEVSENSPKFEEIIIMENRFKSGDFIMERMRNFKSEEEIENACKLILQAMELKHDNLCQIKYNSKLIAKSACIDSHYSLTVAVEYSQNTLQKFILMNNMNLKNGDSFTSFNNKNQNPILEVEHIWYILKSLVDVCNHCHRYHINVGELDPLNIIINEEGEIKLLNCFLLSGISDNLEKGLTFTEYRTCYSPEQLRSLKSFHYNKEISVEKSEVFSVGIIVLSTALSEDFKSFYDFASYEINFKKILKRINLLKNAGYPDNFLDLLKEIFSDDPNLRPDFQFLKNYINKLINPQFKRGFSFFKL